MKIRKLLLPLLWLFCATSFGGIRTEAEMLKIAKQTLANTKGEPKAIMGSSSQYSQKQRGVTLDVFKVYTTGDKGFVIVCADDRFNPVIGYSETETFLADSIPDALTFWLSTISERILTTTDVPTVTSEDPSMKKEEQQRSVNYLLTTRWNQRAPYNNLCPLDEGKKSVTGCVATALAQVMNYYQYPASGTGNFSYTTYTKKIPVSVNITGDAYDWSNMLDEYTKTDGKNNYSNDQGTAVAKLMFHCGASVGMDYSKDASAASSANVAKALIRNFGYDKGARYVKRSWYSDEDLIYILKKEIMEGRPVISDGFNDKSGHTFIIDGYNRQGLFHVNWGWGGLSNGSYDINIMRPLENGAEVASGAFAMNQAFILGVQPQGEVSLYQSNYMLKKAIRYSISAAQIMFNTGFTNYTVSGAESPNYGLAVYTGGEWKVLNQRKGSVLNYLYSFSSISFTVPKQTTLPDGDYKVFIVVKSDDDNGWNVMRAENQPNYVEVSVRSGVMTELVPDGIESTESAKSNNILYKGGIISVFTDNVEIIKIYNLQGVMLKEIKSNAGWNNVDAANLGTKTVIIRTRKSQATIAL